MKALQNFLAMVGILVLACCLTAADVTAQDCCVGRVGDANGSGDEEPTIGDISAMIDAKFIAGTCDGIIPCFAEADINQSAEGEATCDDITIGDISMVIDYLFIAGPETFGPLGDCPEASNVVFVDEYGDGVTYEAYAGSKTDAVLVAAGSAYAGTQGLEVTVPGADPWWSGGAFTDDVARDLSVFNALTFWVKATQAATIDAIGIGDDNTGASKYKAEVVGGLPVTTEWQQYVIPFPLAEKLTSERGMFFFAEGFEGTAPYQISLDEIIFEDLSTISTTSAAIATETLDVGLGETVNPSNGTVVFDIDGSALTMSVMPGYFTFVSNDPGVVSVGGDGVLTAAGEGSTTLTASLGTLGATGTLTVNVTAPEPVPTTPAPTPTQDPGDVISVFSDVYTDIGVAFWSPEWDFAAYTDETIDGDNVKKYTFFDQMYAVLEYVENQDGSAMTHFHMDIWTPNPTASQTFKVKIVDFGANGTYDGEPTDPSYEVTFDDNTLNAGEWVSLDFPIGSIAEQQHLRQLVLSGTLSTVWVDNMYFYDAGLPTEPLVPAPTPTLDPGSVISIFSDAYTNIAMSTWSPEYDHAGYTDEVIGSDNVKKYTFGGEMWALLEYAATQDGSAMTHFHVDIWTPDPTASQTFNVKVVDYGPNGVWDGNPTDDPEIQVSFDDGTLSTGTWVSLEVPLAGLAEQEHLSQLVYSGTLSTVWMDNMYFYSAPPTEPTTSAPTPTHDPGSVISVFSDAYTDISVSTWSPEWDFGAYTDETIGSDNVKKYTFWDQMWALVEYSATQDGSAMTHFHVDIWTPDPTASQTFAVKVVDFGPNGVWDGNPTDDPEIQVTFDDGTLSTGTWVSLEVPLAGLAEQEHLIQLVYSGTLSTVWMDNMYFYSAPPTEPTTSAPTPAHDAGSVISIFSDAYTDIGISTWSPEWDFGAFTDETIGSDNVKKYTFWDQMWALIEYAANQDGTGMTHLHVDIWTPDPTAGQTFNVKVVDFGPNGAWDGNPTDDPEIEVSFDDGTLSTGTWVSLEVPLTGLAEQQHLRQLVFTSGPSTVWVDNIYFYDGSK